MPVQMGFRWYGEGNDNISLNYIKQIPGVRTIVWALHHKMPGDVVESVNIHDDIKIGPAPICSMKLEMAPLPCSTKKGMIQDDYNAMAKYILDFTEKYNMSFPGWEPERMAKLDELKGK